MNHFRDESDLPEDVEVLDDVKKLNELSKLFGDSSF